MNCVLEEYKRKEANVRNVEEYLKHKHCNRIIVSLRLLIKLKKMYYFACLNITFLFVTVHVNLHISHTPQNKVHVRAFRVCGSRFKLRYVNVKVDPRI